MAEAEPKVAIFLDDEERDLIAAIESAYHGAEDDRLMPERARILADAAARTEIGAETRISVVLADADLARLETIAARDGISLDALVGRILHEAVSG